MDQVTATAGQRSARAAIIGFEGEEIVTLRECFVRCGVKLAIAPLNDPARLEQEHFEACVVRLVRGCELYLDALRRSPINPHSVLIGAAGPNADLSPYWSYGFNSLVTLPLVLDEALENIRSSCLLTAGQIRRFVRAPLVTAIDATVDGISILCISREISGGGVSLSFPHGAKVGKSWVLSFTLPDGKSIRLRGTSCWVRENQSTAGVLFDPDDEQRKHVKHWVEGFLGA